MFFFHHLRRELRGLTLWSLALGAATLFLVYCYELFPEAFWQEMNLVLEQMPPQIRAFLGAGLDFQLLNTWVTTEVYTAVLPLLLAVYTGLATVQLLTRESEAGTLNFLLSLPVSRLRVLSSRFAALVVSLGWLHGVVLLTTWLGFVILGESFDWAGYGLITVNLFMVNLAVAALLLLVSVFVDKYNRGLLISLGVALGLHVLPISLESGSRLGWLRGLSPFAYYRPADVLDALVIPAEHLWPLLGAMVCFVALALWRFGRKQLAA